MELTDPKRKATLMCDTIDEFAVCEARTNPNVTTRLYGDLFLCRPCYREVLKECPVNPRCPQCGYWNDAREAGDAKAPCGEPCL